MIDTAAVAVVLLVAALHAYFLVLEMFLWTTPRGMKTFGRTREEQESSKVLAAIRACTTGFLRQALFGARSPSLPSGFRFGCFSWVASSSPGFMAR